MKPALPDRDALAALCGRWKIDELSIFGSGARGELRPDSDIDLAVTFSREADWSLFDFARLAHELSTLFGREVDLIETDQIRNPYRAESIRRDLTVLYAA